MTKREELKLNDFERFEDFLFTKEERALPDEEKWKKYFDENCNFIPPILEPCTIEEHQLCHYTYWKVIFTFRLSRKPCFAEGNMPKSKCYACEWCQSNRFCEDLKLNDDDCIQRCPIRFWSNEASMQHFKQCTQSGSYFNAWFLSPEHTNRFCMAQIIATLPWTNMTKEDHNDSN